MNITISRKILVAANQMKNEEAYWRKELNDYREKAKFPYDNSHKPSDGDLFQSVEYQLKDTIVPKLLRLSNRSDTRLYTLLLTGVVLLLEKYTGNKDIVVGVPVIGIHSEGDILNKVFPLRNRIERDISFKELVVQIHKKLMEGVKNQNYPMEVLASQLELSSEDGFPLYDLVVLLENIHLRTHASHNTPNLIFSFHRTEKGITFRLEYNSSLYKDSTMDKLFRNYENLLDMAAEQIELPKSKLEILQDTERQQLLYDFNNNILDYDKVKTIHRLFEEQAAQTPDKVCALYRSDTMTYGMLNGKSNQLARLLLENGLKTEDVVGVIYERTPDMLIAVMSVLKAGGAYLPLDPGLPTERINYMLMDSNVKLVLTHEQVLSKQSFTKLQNLSEQHDICLKVTKSRPHIVDFNSLPVPDRSLLDLTKYKNKIGMASAINCITIQSTRGCPYECIFCHKVWSKNHVYRSAENIYKEITYYYDRGIRNFSFIDDCFNLNKKNSSRLFQLIIDDKLKLNIFFPNGLRGDLLTPEYIDLMVKAGTCNINLSLETASPRLQKLIKKNLNIEKFREAITYIAEHHPQVILEIATMHGFPTETEEEAMMTMEFIKSIKWIHFPYIHILKIYPNSEMEELALANGVLKEDIQRSNNLAFHELPETLPFPKSFTRKYQADFINDYFLSKERLRQVLPIQIKVLGTEAVVQKYNTYLPTDITCLQDILDFAQLDAKELCIEEKPDSPVPELFSQKSTSCKKTEKKRILLLDLSQYFSSHSMLYNVTEQPLGQMYLLTYLKQEFSDEIDGVIYKSGVDFDDFNELYQLVMDYQPNFIGIRTLTYYKQLFHETVSYLRQWGIRCPIAAGGPYATSDYSFILKDSNVDLALLGEGEYAFRDLICLMLRNNFNLEDKAMLETVDGIAYRQENSGYKNKRIVINTDYMQDVLATKTTDNLSLNIKADNLCYVMYTSGSTGRPKGVMVEHRQVNNCIFWMQKEFVLKSDDCVVFRTNVTFDPSVWELFWPLYVGAKIKILSMSESKDAAYLLKLMEDKSISLMYCPASMLNVMVDMLEFMQEKPVLNMPLLLIGAESVSRDVIHSFYQYYKGEIVNTYGPTECTINNTYHRINRENDNKIIPIGRPVANNQIYILSKDEELLPLYVEGEICIAGDGLARGYINNQEKTEAAFVSNPFGSGRLYKTGDIGRWNQDGNIEILGRIDEQVKIRGYRIELGEITSVLNSYKGVKECIALVKDLSEDQSEIVCKKCGIHTGYPGVKIAENGVCNVCDSWNDYKAVLNQYFKSPEQLMELIQDTNCELNSKSASKFDCLFLYSGGRGSAYALYQLVSRGVKVLAATYDHSYFSVNDLKNIKMILDSMNVEHVILKHSNSNLLLKESMKNHHTVCRGCFVTSSALAGAYAYENNIKMVIGATLSRGQIIENKLNLYFRQGIFDVDEIDKDSVKLQQDTQMINREFYDLLDLSMYRDGTIYDKVKFIDFYRYFDVDNESMLTYLYEKDPYWASRRTDAIYSTNCPLKQIGDYSHLAEKGIHYYGSATSWEKRLGHLTFKDMQKDLTCKGTERGYQNFVSRLDLEIPKQKNKETLALCAYIIGNRELDFAKLRAYLSNQLPSYMVPAYFLQLGKFPLDGNGKIDKKRLPKPEIYKTEDYVKPETEIEYILADIWQEVLELEQVGITDDFFEIGGDSITAMKVNSRINGKFNVNLTLETIFTHATIQELAKEVDKIDKEIVSVPTIALKKGEESYYHPLAPVQLPEWYLHELEPNSSFYNISNSCIIEGDLKLELFCEVWNIILKRHAVLRTSFTMIENKPMQCIAPYIPLKKEQIYVDYTQTAESKPDGLIDKITYEHANIIFDFEKGPLYNLKLIGLPGGKYLFLFVVHHIIWDETSSMNLEFEIKELYLSRISKQSPRLPEIGYSYADYSDWMNESVKKGVFGKQRSYWLNKFETVPKALELPTDFPRPNIQTFHGAVVTGSISKEAKKLLQEFCKENDITLYVLLLSTFNMQLYRLSNQEDFVVGSPYANRDLMEFEPLMGLFACALLLRCNIEAQMTGQMLLRQTKKTVIEAYDNHLYPSNLAIEELNPDKDFSRARMFSVMFGLMNKKESLLHEINFEGLRFDFGRAKNNNETSHFDLTMAADESGEVISFSLNYNTDLYTEKTARRWLDNYLVLLAEIVHKADRPISEYNVMTREERELVTKVWNQTERAYDETQLIHQQIESWAAAFPQRVAVQEEEQRLTYEMLNKRANQLANYLIQTGMQPGDKIGIMMNHSMDMIIAVTGVLKAGGAYVPINIDYPKPRVDYICETAEIKLLITSDWMVSSSLERMPDSNVERIVSSDSPAYVIFTSGTTGKPKGIAIRHRGVINNLTWIQNQYALKEDSATLFHTPFTFDASVLEYLWPLFGGAKIVIPDKEDQKNPIRIGLLTEKHNITFLQFVPEMLHAFLDGLEEGFFNKPESLTYVVCGASAMNRRLVQRFYSLLDCRLANHYGPTETTIDAITYDCSEDFDGDDVPIGTPIANTKVFLLDQHRNPVPIGATGEIYISSPGVALGYVKDEKRTEEHFMRIEELDSGMLYRSGDLAKYTYDGKIVFKGRVDKQVKILGNRIEPEEIESRIHAFQGLSHAAVIPQKDSSGNNYLVAYLEPDRSRNVFRNVRGENYWMYPYSQLPEIKDEMDRIHSDSWPEYFMAAEVFLEYWNRIMREFSSYQIVLMSESNEVTAVGNAIPIYWDGSLDGLPKSWDSGVISAFEPGTEPPNTLMVLAGVVDSKHQKHGLGSLIVQAFKVLARGHGLDKVLIPVRPTDKARHQEVTFDSWCAMRREDGMLQDNWLRIHERLGGFMLKTELKSQHITAKLSDWEQWANMKFQHSGEYNLKDTLQPVSIDVENGCGEYYDPCIWVEHRFTLEDNYIWNYFDYTQIQTYLKKYLPEYMIPASHKFMPQISLLENGKVDYKSLPRFEPVQIPVKEIVKPISETECILSDMWIEILGMEEIDAERSFFEMGGHSLKAAEMVSKIENKFGVKLPLRFILMNPTVREIAREIDRFVDEYN